MKLLALYTTIYSQTYLSKPVDKNSKSTKSKVFLKNFFNKFEGISN